MLPKIEIKRYDTEVEAEYKSLGVRLGELRAQVAQVDREIEKILAGLGKQVADGDSWQKSAAKVGRLRLESEALELGARHIDGQIGLLKRLNTWLRTR